MKKKLLIIGCGDTGKRVLQQLERKKTQIVITNRQQISDDQLSYGDVNIVSIDLDEKESLASLSSSDAYIFYFVPPPGSGEQDNRMLNFIQSLAKDGAPKRIVYISTTGVYGDCQGKWVTEQTAVTPGNARSKRRLHAESLLQSYCEDTKTEYVILRVSGIYCLEKLPLERLKQGMQVLQPQLAPFSNRIHADDLARFCLSAMFDGPGNEVFNIADGNPSSISDYFIQISRAFGLPTPELLNWKQAKIALSPAMLSYLNESKKVSNEKLCKMLGVKVKYSTLEQGLQQCVAQSTIGGAV